MHGKAILMRQGSDAQPDFVASIAHRPWRHRCGKNWWDRMLVCGRYREFRRTSTVQLSFTRNSAIGQVANRTNGVGGALNLTQSGLHWLSQHNLNGCGSMHDWTLRQVPHDNK